MRGGHTHGRVGIGPGVREAVSPIVAARGGGGDDAAAGGASLARHDVRETANAERRKREEGKRRARGEWLRRYMGPVMYEIDAWGDLVSALIPASRKKKCRDGTAGRRGIVMRMS